MNALDAVLILSATLAIFLTQQPNRSAQRYACIVGIIGQPVWFYLTYTMEQWGMFVCSLLYTVSWGIGLWRYWIKKPRVVIRTEAEIALYEQLAEMQQQYAEESKYGTALDAYLRLHSPAVLNRFQDHFGKERIWS